MNFDRIEYQVGELAAAPEVLTIDRDGRARYESHTNWRALDRPEIGTYETTLPPADLQRLESALANPPFEGLSDHWGRVRSGDHYRRVRVSVGGTDVEKLVGTNEAIDPTLQAVLNRLDAVISELVRHPRAVLRVELRRPELSDRSTLSFVMVLSAIGTEPVSCRNPVDLMGGENRVALGQRLAREARLGGAARGDAARSTIDDTSTSARSRRDWCRTSPRTPARRVGGVSG